MDELAKDLMVLGAIQRGSKKFDKIQKETKIEPEKLDQILEKLEKRGLIKVQEKKGFLGKKIEILVTEKGTKELDERLFELKENWDQMVQLYKKGDKKQLENYMNDNRGFLPTMMFFGIIDIMMFSMMFSMMGAMMTDYVPAEDVPADMSTGDESMGDGGGMDDGGFDFDIGF